MNWKVIAKSLNQPEMRKRILAVLGMLLAYRILTHIPIPISNPHTLKQILDNVFNSSNTPQFLSFLNSLSGGALANFAIMVAGLGPYINASIIMQLLTKALPKLENLRKEGEFGQKKINQYTRLLTLPLAIIQAVGAVYLIRQTAQQIGGIDITAHASLFQWVLMVGAITGGSMLLMWLGELITEQGVGNGISLLITIGIVSRLPSSIQSVYKALVSHADKHISILGVHLPFSWRAVAYGGGIAVVVLILTWIVVKLNEAARRLTVNYAKRVQGNRAYGGVTTTLPIKLISAGVIPIIFAVAFLTVPSFVGQVLSNSHSLNLQHLGAHLTAWFASPTAATFAQGGWQPYIYPVAYFFLVFMFTYFYTNVNFNAKEISENLQKQGAFIEGVRSGKQTEKYLSRIVNRLTLFGAISLGLLAILPIIAQAFVNASLAIGGTSILILVSVSLETLRAIESRALMVTYDQYSQPDFFHDTADEEEVKTARRLSFARIRPNLRKKSK